MSRRPQEMSSHESNTLPDTISSLHAPLVQAALVHAQFETIHPLHRWKRPSRPRADPHGPGPTRPSAACCAAGQPRFVDLARVVRSGLERQPIRRRPSRVGCRGLVSRTGSRPFWTPAWPRRAQATQLAVEVRELESSGQARIAAHRAAAGKRTLPRADSATAHILTRLTEVPVMTTATALRILQICFQPPERRWRTWLRQVSCAGRQSIAAARLTSRTRCSI